MGAIGICWLFNSKHRERSKRYATNFTVSQGPTKPDLPKVPALPAGTKKHLFQTLQCMTVFLYVKQLDTCTFIPHCLHKPRVLKAVWDFCVHLQARSERLDGRFPEGTTFHQEIGLCSERFQLKHLALLRSWQPSLDACLHVFLGVLWSWSLFNSMVSNLGQPEILSAALKLQESSAENGRRWEAEMRNRREEHHLQRCPNKLLTSMKFSFVIYLVMCTTLPSLSKDICCPDLKIFLVELYLS